MDAALPLFSALGGQSHEMCVLAYLDAGDALIGVRHTPALDPTNVTVPLRRIVADAMALQCSTVVMAHNHPSGDPSPSAADLVVTRRLARVLDALGICLADHVIVAGARSYSLRAAGLL